MRRADIDCWKRLLSESRRGHEDERAGESAALKE